MTPKTSIIIPNWNGMKFIERCVRSVQESTYADYEIIVVDNGSTDGSRELVEQTFPDVRILSMGRNVGFARGCNQGIKAARGEYIVLLNNDIEVEKEWLGELIKGMGRHPECTMGTSKMVQYDNRAQIYNTGDQFKTCCTGGGRGFGEIDAGQYETEEYVFGACAGAGIYRKSLFETIGNFDEDFFIFAEDVDLNLRAQLRGKKCIYLPRAIVYHWGTATVGFNSNRHVFLFLRNNLFVLVKNYMLKELFRYGRSILKEMLNGTLSASLNGQGWTVFKSRLSFLAFLPKMLGKRVRSVKRRKVALEEIGEIIK